MSDKLNRKDLVLLLLFAKGSSGAEAEPIDGRTRLMKLLFLLQEDYSANKYLDPERKYKFIPYHYGPFTNEIYDDLEFLENFGLVEASSKGNPASPVEQNEENIVLEDMTIGEQPEELGVLFEEESYKLTDAGLKFAREKLAPFVSESLMQGIRELKSKFSDTSLTALLRYVYTKHPEYTVNSKLTYLSP